MLQGRAKKPKDKPVPLLFPASLYSAIRSSCIYLALDDNPDNSLNRSSAPILRRYDMNGTSIELFCYTPDLLKMWLRFLVSQPLWSRTVTVSKPIKSKTGYGTYGSSGTVDVKCLHIPSPREIQQSATTGGMSIEELQNCANQISSLLINIGPASAKLLLPSEVPPHSIPSSSQIATPSNITKQARLSDVGYIKHGLGGHDASDWENFYAMEVARYKYLLAQVSTTRVSDASIKSLSDTDRDLYNDYAVSSYIGTMAHYKVAVDAPVNEAMNKVSHGNAVNPAILAYQHLAATNKNNKFTTGPSNNKKYSDMIEKYHRLTRFKLDIKSEKLAKTLPFRTSDIEWMEELSSKYAFIQFVHNSNINRPEVVMSSVQHLISAQPQMSQQTGHVQQAPQQLAQASVPHQMQQVAYQQQRQPSYVPVNPMGTYHQPAALSHNQIRIPDVHAHNNQVRPTAIPIQTVAPSHVPTSPQSPMPPHATAATQQVPPQDDEMIEDELVD